MLWWFGLWWSNLPGWQKGAIGLVGVALVVSVVVTNRVASNEADERASVAAQEARASQARASQARAAQTAMAARATEDARQEAIRNFMDLWEWTTDAANGLVGLAVLCTDPELHPAGPPQIGYLLNPLEPYLNEINAVTTSIAERNPEDTPREEFIEASSLMEEYRYEYTAAFEKAVDICTPN